MALLHSEKLIVNQEEKEISVFCDDITHFGEAIDILTTSAFINAYAPTPRTVFAALADIGISVRSLSRSPEIDLRKPCHVWLSQNISHSNCKIGRIGCIELLSWKDAFQLEDCEQSMISSIRSFFSMLDIGAIYGIKMDCVALPMIGGGSQGIAPELIMVPLINECISALNRNLAIRKICFVEKNRERAELLVDCLKKSHRFSKTSVPTLKSEQIKRPLAFISYSSKDKNIADNLCSKLESRGIRVWYAPRDVHGPYAESIARAIEEASYFVVILSENSMASQHVLNEIDLAFQKLPLQIRFMPLRIDSVLLTPSFKYYLSRQHWLDATIPPLEKRLLEFVEKILQDYGENTIH